MTASPGLPPDLKDYLHRLAHELSGPPETVREWLLETEAHFRDALGSGLSADEIIRGFGPAALYARELSDGLKLRAATDRASALPVVAVLLRRVVRSAGALLIAGLVLILAVAGLAFAALVVLEAVSPANTGLWVGPQGVFLGSDDQWAQGDELLGAGMIPVAVLGGAACMAGARWLLLRWARLVVAQGRPGFRG